jgi:predicted transcriptional regulator
MHSPDKNELFEFEILKHVEQSSLLNNRLMATKLGCSVKLAHELLRKMVDRGFLHVKKLHSRRWDYFITPHGISEKIRLTYEFLDFSMHFYREARKESSKLCLSIAESGKKNVALLGANDLAEIAFLSIKEWNLDLIEIFDNTKKKTFLGHTVFQFSKIPSSKADAIIVCEYDRKNPLSRNYLPEKITRNSKMLWIFGNTYQNNRLSQLPKHSNKTEPK